jgi:hypothetical protein
MKIALNVEQLTNMKIQTFAKALNHTKKIQVIHKGILLYQMNSFSPKENKGVSFYEPRK